VKYDLPVKQHQQICDVIFENVAFCGTNIVGPDQTPRIMRGV